MNTTLLSHLLPIFLVFLAAGLVKGVVGMGLPLVAMGVLSLWLPPVEAAALLSLPTLLTNVQQALGPDTRTLLRRLWPMLAAIAVGIAFGAGILAGHDPSPARAGLGTLLVLYALLGLARWQPQLAPRWEAPLAPFIGITTGLLAGATGVLTLPSVPYLTALRLSREALMQALGLCFGTASVSLALALASRGAFPTQALLPSLLALLPTALGVVLGTKLRRRISPDTFRRIFFLILLVLGAQLVWQALMR